MLARRRSLVSALLGAASLVAVPLTPVRTGDDPARPGDLSAQEASPHAGEAFPDAGAVATGLLLRSLDGVKRVLMIGAHPDDEDTALLATLARGWGARAAYLSLTRGEGGQNLIGPELGEALGLLRAGELLAARRLDGAEQWFTRAYDFGYSKTAEETFRLWPRDSLLADVVWAIRVFRPHVVVSVFSGTPADGHGQHQAAGILARQAFRAAADPERFPEQLRLGVRPWAPVKLYRRTWRDPEAATLGFETGRLDPLLGRSHHQLAMESRSQHRSQAFGTAQPAGPRETHLALLETRGRAAADTSLFAGVDTSLVAMAEGLPRDVRDVVRREIEAYRSAVERARRELRALDPGPAVPPLLEAVAAVGRAIAAAEDAGEPGREAAAELREKRERAGRALLAAASVRLILRAEDHRIVPGQRVRVVAEVWNGGAFPLRPAAPVLEAPAGWRVSGPARDEATLALQAREAGAEAGGGGETDRPGSEAAFAFLPGAEGEADAGDDAIAPGSLRRWFFEVHVPDDARPSEAIHLRRSRVGALYRWPEDPALRGRAGEPSLLRGRVEVEVDAGGEGSVRVSADVPVRHREVDRARGEIWRPVLVAPRASVAIEPERMVWPEAETAPRPLVVRVDTEAPEGARGRVRLDAPPGWAVEPAQAPFALAGPGASAALMFSVRPVPGPAAPGREGEERIRAVAEDEEGRTHARSFALVDYPHIDPIPHLREGSTALHRFPVRVAGDPRVGYVMGSGDDVPGAIRQLGVAVEELDEEALARGPLDRFDVVVLGIRAYEARPDLRRTNARLLEWTERGGVLIVQYNRYELEEEGLAPLPIRMRRPHERVTDEEAPVRLLHPDAPVLARPNRITEEDFRGWVQERGLYFLSEWDRRLVPLLEMADPGEEPLRGALLVAPVGRGAWVYTGLALFRQLPAGVPGAYRLLANLLSLDPAAWRAWAGGA